MPWFKLIQKQMVPFNKVNFGQKFWVKKILSTKMFAQDFLSQNFFKSFGQKKFLDQKRLLVQKRILVKKNVVKKNWSKKNCQKSFLDQKDFLSEKSIKYILGPKKFLSGKTFDPKKICFEKFLGLKFFLDPQTNFSPSEKF